MRISIKRLCFYIFIVFIAMYYAFRKSTMDYSIWGFTLYLSIPFLIAKVTQEKYTYQEAVYIGILLGVGFISVFMVNDTSILIAFCVVIGMKNIDYYITLKIVFWIRLLTTTFLIICANLNFIPNIVYMREGIRYSMGYTHPNIFGIYSFVLISLWFILYGECRWKLKWVVSFALGIYQYVWTKSRTSLVLILFFLFLVILSKRIQKMDIFLLCAKYSALVCLVLNILVTRINESRAIAKLNILLSSRINLSKGFLKVYGIGILGKRVGDNVSADNYWHLDSGYLNLFIRFGLIIGCIYVYMIIKICNKKYIKNVYIYIAIIMFSIYGLVENVLDSFLYNYLWIIIGMVMFRDLNKKLND